MFIITQWSKQSPYLVTNVNCQSMHTKLWFINILIDRRDFELWEASYVWNERKVYVYIEPYDASDAMCQLELD